MVRNNISADYFIQYRAEYDFIDQHYHRYGQVPDKTVFAEKFTAFDFVDVNESEKYLTETLQEQFTYSKLVPCVKKIAELCTEDSNRAVAYAQQELETIRRLSVCAKKGTDLIKTFTNCAEEYKKRMETKGLLGISSGIKEIDEATHGWIAPDVVNILGRLNEGKSWLLFMFLINAWMEKVPVMLYSGEMECLFLQMRFAALHGKFSNMGLMSGKADLKNGKTFADFFDYLKKLTNNTTPFIILTPKDLKSRKLTISELKSAIEAHRPGLVGIDQMSLMEDERAGKGDPKRISYTNLSEDLYSVSEQYMVPILAAVQANRGAVDKKKADNAPNIEDVYESDGVAQNSTRLLALKQDGDRLMLALRKNRYGLRGQEWRLRWDVDTGDIGFLPTDQFQPVTPAAVSVLKGEDLF